MVSLVIVLAFLISAGFTRVLLHPSSKFYLLDFPNDRSLHAVATPRGGGVAIVAAIFVSATVLVISASGNDYFLWIGLGGVLVAAISLLDDRYNLAIVYRLPAHMLAACILVYGKLSIEGLELPGVLFIWPQAVAALLTVVFVVWMLNLYNFMDGMDGFAAGMTVIGFGIMAMLGWVAGEKLFAAFNASVAAASAGFLIFNFPPARIFMGDVGSSTLGFLAAASALWGVREHVFALWVALLVFSPFIVDATVTLVRRALKGNRIWKAHKSHYYQRLVLLGWGHRKTVLWEYLLMLLSGGSGLIVVRLPVAYQWLVLAIWAVLYVVLIWSVGRLEMRKHVA